MKRLVVQVNSVIFFGEELASNAQFTEALLRFPEEVYTTAELLRVTPGVLTP